jgi:hypothetical protein
MICFSDDSVAPDKKAKFFSSNSQLLFTFTVPDTRGLRLRIMKKYTPEYSGAAPLHYYNKYTRLLVAAKKAISISRSIRLNI